MQILADGGPALDVEAPVDMGSPDLSAAPLSIMPCIIFWTLSFAGIFYALGIQGHMPSIFSKPIVSAEPKAQ